ncbi:hypothetical protein Pelo_12505 [Pelomyxa schiedti]|nr:hypothetical protein Pelo_12505 [Pelomyxa schiedti]
MYSQQEQHQQQYGTAAASSVSPKTTAPPRPKRMWYSARRALQDQTSKATLQLRSFQAQLALRKSQKRVKGTLNNMWIKWREPNLSPSERSMRVDNLNRSLSEQIARLEAEVKGRKNKDKIKYSSAQYPSVAGLAPQVSSTAGNATITGNAAVQGNSPVPQPPVIVPRTGEALQQQGVVNA